MTVLVPDPRTRTAPHGDPMRPLAKRFASCTATVWLDGVYKTACAHVLIGGQCIVHGDRRGKQ